MKSSKKVVVGRTFSINTGRALEIEAREQITTECKFSYNVCSDWFEVHSGSSFIRIQKDGKITISGSEIDINATKKISLNAARIDFN